MKKYILSGAVILAVTLYIIRERAIATQIAIDNTITDQTPTLTPTPNPTPNTTVPNYKDGQYTGSVADAFYGPLQVKAIIKGGKITDVQFLQYPNDRPESIQVNNRSNPLLRAEAIQIQSANVDIVSGATQSAEAFQKSLAVALAQAK